MWIKELGELYVESEWRDHLTNPGPPNKAGWSKPAETQLGLSYKGTFARGGGDYNPVTTSTYEQEEDEMISKNTILSLIDNELNSGDLDRHTIFSLTTLKSKIQKL